MFGSFLRVRFVFCALIVCSVALAGCGESEDDVDDEEPIVRTVELSAEEAARQAERIQGDVSVNLADGFAVELWASDSLLGDPVGLHMDYRGHAYVTQTRRHRQQEFDIRDVPQWRIPSITLQTVEERREFLREELAPERSDENTWLRDFNEDGSHDWHDLTALSETIYRIDDMDGDGLANRSEVFYEGFNEEITDIAAGVFAWEDQVYASVAPDFWRMEDTTGDGWADSRESLAHGFGIHIGFSGHGLSGPTMGPDGRIYWAMGDFGVNVEKDGEHWKYPNQGAIMRANPDGSDFEVYARGLRNTHEFVFDEYGNLLTVDNDGDHPGEPERLLYVVSGSDSGWRINWQIGKYSDPDNNDYKVWMDEELFRPRFDGQAAYILPPISDYDAGPSGLAYNPGTALGEEWRNHTFVSEFTGTPPRSRISAFELEEDGAGFSVGRHVEVLDGIQATSLDFGPDGALYMADWIEGWGMNNRGRIWKLDTPDDADQNLRDETQELLVADLGERSVNEVAELLSHDDMRVRQRAQFELADRGSDGADAFADALQDDHQLKRIHAIWGMGQLIRYGQDVGDELANYLNDGDAEIRAQAAKTLGDVRYEQAGDELVSLLEDESLRVQFFAAEALGRMESQDAVEPILEMLEENDDEDAYLRHGGAIALARIGDADRLVELQDHDSRALRVAAVVALRRMEDPGVATFLDDEDEYVVTEAARAINDDFSIEDALPDLAETLEEERFSDEALIRRAINANQRVGEEEQAERLANFATRSGADADMRAEALNALAVWPNPSILDRVDGRYRGEVERDTSIARDAIAGRTEQLLLQEASEEVRLAAAEAVGRLAHHDAGATLLAVLQNDSSPAVRSAALNAFDEMNHAQLATAVGLALEDADQEVRMTGISLAQRVDDADEPIADMLMRVVEQESTEEAQTALEALGALQSEEAQQALDRLMGDLLAENVQQEIHLDLLMAAESNGSPELMEQVEAYREVETGEEETVEGYRETLYGGQAERGEDVFRNHVAASCMRCHAVAGQGGDVGPDLTDVGARMSREELLQSLVNPSAHVAPGYGIVTITTEDGERISGTLLEETSGTLAIRSGGERREIALNEIAERQDAPSSMPPMGPVLTRHEIRDLVEYLNQLQGGQ